MNRAPDHHGRISPLKPERHSVPAFAHRVIAGAEQRVPGPGLAARQRGRDRHRAPPPPAHAPRHAPPPYARAPPRVYPISTARKIIIIIPIKQKLPSAYAIVRHGCSACKYTNACTTRAAVKPMKQIWAPSTGAPAST